MGLNCSHGAFDGAYSKFHFWRLDVARAAGYSVESGPASFGIPNVVLDWSSITDDNEQGLWGVPPDDPLIILLAHSDCDGVIAVRDAGPLADRLEALLPALPTSGTGDRPIQEITTRFIAGLRRAVAANEPVRFG